MSYKTILLHLHDLRRADRLLDAAVPLARAMNAHLTAVCVMPPFVVIPAMDGPGVSVTVDEHRDAYRKDMDKLKAKFEATVAGQQLSSEWRQADANFGSVAGTLIEHGRAADLIIVSQRDPEWGSSSLLEDPERLAMDSGRPVLIIPNAGSIALPAKRVTVAWNGRREAARAVFDAMQLLEQADDVNVLCINPESMERSGDLPTAEICSALSRHGIKCQGSQASALGPDVCGEMLRQASAFGSGMLVMGCYGHSRLREFILGGASRHVLAEMRIPVLMAH